MSPRYVAVTGCAGEEEAFRTYVLAYTEHDCWIWAGGVMSTGYGMFSASKFGIVCKLAHRWSYERYVGPIPTGHVIDHICNDKLCVNPRHLRVVSQRENILRGNGGSAKCARRTCCDYGHALAPENTLARGGCKQCKNRRDREDHARHLDVRRAHNREKMRAWRAKQRA